MSYDIGREAARIRAATGMRTPDALIIATALVTEVDVLVTNDRSWRATTEAIAPGLEICLLADLARAVS